MGNSKIANKNAIRKHNQRRQRNQAQRKEFNMRCKFLKIPMIGYKNEIKQRLWEKIKPLDWPGYLASQNLTEKWQQFKKDYFEGTLPEESAEAA